MAMEYTKPLPVPDLDTLPFWQACKRHELKAQKCSSCASFRWRPRGLCPKCRSWEFQWVSLEGTGTIYSFVVVHHVTVPAFADDVPYVIAHVTLDGTGGEVRMTTNIIDCPWKEVQVGMRVTVVFDDVTPDCTLPKFRPLRA